MASIVTVEPLRSSISISCGIAVISLVFSPTFNCPSVIAFSDTQALTMWMGLLSFMSLALRIRFPSMLTSFPSAPCTMDEAHSMKWDWKDFGSRFWKKRLSVSSVGMPLVRSRYFSKKSRLYSAKSAISSQPSSPLSAPTRTMKMMFFIGWRILPCCRGSSSVLK